MLSSLELEGGENVVSLEVLEPTFAKQLDSWRLSLKINGRSESSPPDTYINYVLTTFCLTQTQVNLTHVSLLDQPVNLWYFAWSGYSIYRTLKIAQSTILWFHFLRPPVIKLVRFRNICIFYSPSKALVVYWRKLQKKNKVVQQ